MKWEQIPSYRSVGEKWELKNGDFLLGTIFKKHKDKYSLWISTPLVVDKILSIATRSYECETLDEAVSKFRSLYNEQVIPWAKSVCEAADKTWEPPSEENKLQ